MREIALQKDATDDAIRKSGRKEFRAGEHCICELRPYISPVIDVFFCRFLLLQYLHNDDLSFPDSPASIQASDAATAAVVRPGQSSPRAHFSTRLRYTHL